MFYTPEPPLYIVVEVPPFATNKQLAGLVNEHLPNPEHHIEEGFVIYGHDNVRYDFEYDEQGRIVTVTPVVISIGNDGTPGLEFPQSPVPGGAYLAASCNSLTGVRARWFTDQIDSIDNKPIHPYTDIYVTL